MGVDCMRKPAAVGCSMAVRGVAVGADRRIHLAGRDRLAVDAFHVVRGDARMAVAAGLRNVGLEGGAGRILAAEDVVRAVAALAVGRDQQAFLGQRRSVNRIDVGRKDIGEAVLLRHAVFAVAGAAGLGHVQRIDGGPLVILGKNGVRVAVATGAGMLGGVGVDAAGEFLRLARVALVALDLGDLVGVRIFLDVGVAVVALEAAVNALAEGVAIDADVVAGGVLQAFVGMAGEAVGLGRQPPRHQAINSKATKPIRNVTEISASSGSPPNFA